jgi:hypothetical protein
MDRNIGLEETVGVFIGEKMVSSELKLEEAT